MALPQSVLDFINENAQRESVAPPSSGDDLFKSGVLDSFTLVDFVTVLEAATDISIPDTDVNPVNFRTIEAVERYVEARRG